MSVPPNEEQMLQELGHRQRFLRGPQQMGEVLNQLMARRGYGQVKGRAACQQAWEEAVGERLAKDTRPGVIRRGVLNVMVRDSIVLQELSFEKQRILQQLADRWSGSRVRELRLQVGWID